MLTTITIPRPHVPTGPLGVHEDRADADYLRAVISKIDTGYTRVGGSGVTAMIRSLVADAAEALETPPNAPGRDIVQLVRDLIDPDECWFDHNGGCQAHGYFSLQPGELCPNAEAKAWISEMGA
ncbi:hypothetical protein [Microbacterium sp. gxy059]|uniref:hypothetical protein n=1 Tax=Microbacterium sp. gxy059 TaxID=2957199 RepID=UPI003D954CD3